MVKIKQEEQLNLPQLIEWMWSSKKSAYKITSNMNGVVKLEPYGLITFSSRGFYPEETFTIEVEELVTKDTVIPKIVELDSCGYDQHDDLFMQENKSINQILNEDEVKNKAFYILNDDLTMTLIWRDGKLVE